MTDIEERQLVVEKEHFQMLLNHTEAIAEIVSRAERNGATWPLAIGIPERSSNPLLITAKNYYSEYWKIAIQFEKWQWEKADLLIRYHRSPFTNIKSLNPREEKTI